MAGMNQDEILSNTRTVMQGLGNLRLEHNQMLNALLSSGGAMKDEADEVGNVGDQISMLKKSIEAIDLAIGEAQVKGRKCRVVGDGRNIITCAPECSCNQGMQDWQNLE